MFLLALLMSCSKAKYEPVDFNVRIKSVDDDILQLFYVDDPKLSYTDSLLIRKRISGKDAFQNITFKIPTEKQVLKLRFDIGEKGSHSNIIIESINIVSGDKSILIDQSNFHRFFKPNIYIETEDFKLFKRDSINGKYDPFFLSKALLEKKMQIEFR